MPRGRNKANNRCAGKFIRPRRYRVFVKLEERPLWEMYVPVTDNRGVVFPGGHVKRFFKYVLKMSGGSTENPWSSGKWIHEGQLYNDRIVPVYFFATAEQAERLAKFAVKLFKQKVVVYFLVSDRVHLCHRVRTTNFNRSLRSSGRTNAARRPKFFGKRTAR